MSILLRVVHKSEHARRRERTKLLEHRVELRGARTDDIMRALLHAGPRGMAYSELANALNTHPNCVTRGVHVLRASGLVRLAGLSPRGPHDILSKVWVATARARTYHAPDKAQICLEAYA